MTSEANHIKKVWDEQAIKYGVSHDASWGDLEMIMLEVEAVSSQIPKSSVVLDLGCANGFTTKLIAERTSPKRLFASDFSELMIKNAVSVLSNSAPEVNVFVGDACDIKLESNLVDVCYAIRVIINLPTWELQLRAIEECIRVTKSGGRVVLSEGFWEPLVRLNSIRAILGLKSLVEHDFNRYLKRERLERFLVSKRLRYEIYDFSSMYYLGSRIARELATDFESFEGFSNPINSDFATLARKYKSCGDIGVQQMVVIHKD